MSSETLDRGAAREIAPDILHGIPSARRRFRLNPRLGIAALGLLAATAVAGYGWNWWEVGRFVETTNDAYVGGNVTTLSPHVAGFVTKILVNDNQLVKAGQLLIQLDDRDYKANLAHAEAVVQHQTAALANLHAKYELQKSMIAEAEAKLAADQAEAGYARADAQRYHALAVTTYGSLQNDQKASAADRKAQAVVRSGQADLDAAKQQLSVIDTEIAETQASLAQAQADLRTAELDLGYTEIRAPIDGYVGNRAAQIGAYATIGTALLAIIPGAFAVGRCQLQGRRTRAYAAGAKGKFRRRRAAGAHLQWPGPEPRSGNGRHFQRNSAGKRDRQLYQDRPARPGADRPRR